MQEKVQAKNVAHTNWKVFLFECRSLGCVAVDSVLLMLKFCDVRNPQEGMDVDDPQHQVFGGKGTNYQPMR